MRQKKKSKNKTGNLKKNTEEIEIFEINNVEEIFEDIFIKYGELHNEYHSLTIYLKEKFPDISEKYIEIVAFKMFEELDTKYDGSYKNIIIKKYYDQWYIHILRINLNIFKFIDNIFNSFKINDTVLGVIWLFILPLVISMVVLFFDISPYHFFLGVFFVISSKLIIIYGIEIILILTATYILVKNILLILQSIGITFLPYIEYFDPNIYGLSLVLIFLMISFPIILDILFIVTMLPLFLLKIKKGHNVVSNNDLLRKTIGIWIFFDNFKKKYKMIILKISSFRGISFNLFLANEKKIFMWVYFFSIFYFLCTFRFDLNMFYYDKNNGYCSNIGDNVLINKSHKSENMIYILLKRKISDYEPLYYFKYQDNDKYVYETSCIRNIIDVNSVNVYSTSEIRHGIAPKNIKIIFYGKVIKDSVDINDNVTKFKIKTSNDDEIVTVFYSKYDDDTINILKNENNLIFALGKNIDNTNIKVEQIAIIPYNSDYEDFNEDEIKNGLKSLKKNMSMDSSLVK